MTGEKTPRTDPAPNPRRWFEGGLRFACTRCGNCCTGHGTVRVDEDEERNIAAHLGMATHDFRARYLHRIPDGSRTLIEKENTDCVFFERGAGCTVYPVRPRQCRTWPFWRGNVATRKHWSSAAEGCPGMNQGPLHEADAIEKTAAEDGTSGIVPVLDDGT